MNYFRSIVSFLSVLMLQVFYTTAYAAGGSKYPTFSPPPTGNAPITSVNATFGILVSIIDFSQVAFWICAAGFGLYAAYLYLFSQGSTEAISRAQKMLIYTVIAMVLAIVAYGIPAIITNFVFIGAHG